MRRTLAILSIALLTLLGTSLSSVVSAQPRTATAHLTSGQEVPPVDSRATGQAIFRLDRSGETIHYRLIVANIQDVTMAHIHLAPAGVNGPVVVWLYPDGPPPQLRPGRSSGVLATGTITSDDLVGPLAGQGLEVLLEAFDVEGAYVNVHTSAFPAGEVRGQIR